MTITISVSFCHYKHCHYPYQLMVFEAFSLFDENTGIVLALELRIGMNENDHRSYLSLVISSSEKGQKNSDLNGDSNLDLCDAGAVLFELSYQVNKE